MAPAAAALLVSAVALALALALPATACDLPLGTCACSSWGCRNSALGWARLPPSAAARGLGSMFEFGLSLNTSNPNNIVTGPYVGNRNYEYLFVNSTPPFGSGRLGESVTDNLVDPSNLPQGPSFPPLMWINDVDTCCAMCAATPTCKYYAFYPLEPVYLIGLYAQRGGVPIKGVGKTADPFQYPFIFPTDPLAALPDGIETQCVLLTKRNFHGLTFRANQYAFDGDAQPQLGKANPKAIIGGTCNSDVTPCF